MTPELILTEAMMAKNVLARMISETRRKRTHNRREAQLRRKRA